MIEEINYLSKSNIPFLFIIDFECANPIIIPIESIDNEQILYNINGFTNILNDKEFVTRGFDGKLIFNKNGITFDSYKSAFLKVKDHFINGNSYLLNLTFPTEIEINLTLKEIYMYSLAKYKLFLKDRFVCFSPETFIKIQNNTIESYPMKGTIDATIPNAYEKILSDEKEYAEHITIVDLIRNDLGQISKNVRVERFRYVDFIKTHNKYLLQVSSKICGDLKAGWRDRLGEILYSLLPAGSVTGAPKKKTVQIIKSIENYNRDYYTGICGYYMDNYLESGVLIRYIENLDNKLYFKSGGGLTIYSDVTKEYNELLEKVYVPINRIYKN